METIKGSELRRRLAARGLRQADLAAAAGLFPTSLSAILNGDMPIGDIRRARLEAAITALGLDRPTPDPAPPAHDPVFLLKSKSNPYQSASCRQTRKRPSRKPSGACVLSLN